MRILGVDPGKGGAMAVLTFNRSGIQFDIQKLDAEDEKLWGWLRDWMTSRRPIDVACVERVQPMRRRTTQNPDGTWNEVTQGVSSTAKFMTSYGFVRGIVTASEIPKVEYVTPQVWKKKMGLQGEPKKASREQAKARFPKQAKEITNVTAEAILLAMYYRINCQ